MKHITDRGGQHAEFLLQPVVYNQRLRLGFEGLRNYKEHSQYDNYARDWTTEESWFDFRMRQEMCLFSETWRPHSGAHPPSYSLCSDGFPGRKSNNKPLPRAEVKNEWSCIYSSSCVFVLCIGSNLPLFTDEIKMLHVAPKATEEQSKVNCNCRCLVKFPRHILPTTTTSGDCSSSSSSSSSSSFVTFSVNMAPVGHTVHHLDMASDILNTLSNSFSLTRFEVSHGGVAQNSSLLRCHAVSNRCHRCFGGS